MTGAGAKGATDDSMSTFFSETSSHRQTPRAWVESSSAQLSWLVVASLKWLDSIGLTHIFPFLLVWISVQHFVSQTNIHTCHGIINQPAHWIYWMPWTFIGEDQAMWKSFYHAERLQGSGLFANANAVPLLLKTLFSFFFSTLRCYIYNIALIWSLRYVTKSALVPTNNFITQSKLSVVKKILPTISTLLTTGVHGRICDRDTLGSCTIKQLIIPLSFFALLYQCPWALYHWKRNCGSSFGPYQKVGR